MAAFLVLLTAIGAAPTCDPRVEWVFQRRECSFSGGRYHKERVRYRLYAPEVKTGQQYPLILWLHGWGEIGDDNRLQLSFIDWFFTEPAHPEQFPAFILIPQCPKDNRDWFRQDGLSILLGPGEKTDEMLSVAMETLEKTKRDYPIDENRVYVAGLYNGADGALELGMRYPNTFAAMLCFRPSHADSSRAENLADTIVWAFTETPAPTQIQRIVANVNGAGGNAHVTELSIDLSQSGCNWYPTFETYGLVDWLLSQRRGATVCANPPGPMLHERGRWHRDLLAHLAVPLGAVIFAVILWCTFWRQRG